MSNALLVIKGTLEVIVSVEVLERTGVSPENTDVLLLGTAPTLPIDLRSDIKNLLQKFGNWRSVSEAILDTDFDLDLATDHLRKRFEGYNPTIILCDSLFDIGNKALFDTFATSRIILFDNGISSHTERKVVRGPNSSKAQYIRYDDVQRVDAAYFLSQKCRPLNT